MVMGIARKSKSIHTHTFYGDMFKQAGFNVHSILSLVSGTFMLRTNMTKILNGNLSGYFL